MHLLQQLHANYCSIFEPGCCSFYPFHSCSCSKVRFRNHKSSMLTNKKSCELAVHFDCTQHVISEISFIVIEKITSQGDATYIDKLLLTREAYWTAQLCTLNPHGLNKRREFRSKNRVRYNTKLAYYYCVIKSFFTTYCCNFAIYTFLPVTINVLFYYCIIVLYYVTLFTFFYI